MLSAHDFLAYFVVGVPALAALAGGLVYWRRRVAGRWLAHLLALAQTLLVAQVALGLLLLSDDRRAADDLHYAYGSLVARGDPGAVDVRAGGRPDGGCSGSPAPPSSPRRSPCEHS